MALDVSNNETDRKLDVAVSASVDVVALNNQIVGMRKPVQKAKVHVMFKLTRKVGALKKKRGTEEQVGKNMRKAERFLDELDIIKNLGPDKISRYALANTMLFAEVSKQSKTSVERRALARLCEDKLLKDIVEKFRSEHEDWNSLVSFIVTKQSGRRFRKKPYPGFLKANKVITNQKIGNELVQNFLSKRLEGYDLELSMKKPKSTAERHSDVSDKVLPTISVSKSNISHPSDSLSLKVKNTVIRPDTDSESDDNESVDTASNNTNNDTTKESTTTLSMKDKSIVLKDKHSDVTVTDSTISSRDKTDIKLTKDTIASSINEAVIDDAKVKSQGTDLKPISSTMPQSARYMVVKKLNLAVISSDNDEIQVDEPPDEVEADQKPKDPAAAFPTGTSSGVSHGQSDGFFMTADKGDDMSDEANNNDRHNDDVRNYRANTGYSGMSGKDVGKKRFDSVFVSSLGDNQFGSKPHFSRHSNYDHTGQKHAQKVQWPKQSQKYPRNHDNVNEKWQNRSGIVNEKRPSRNDFEKKNPKSVQSSKSNTNIPNDSKSERKANKNLDSKASDKEPPAESDSSSLHPSWQASKRRKELASQIHQYQGKKIKFADSDDD